MAIAIGLLKTLLELADARKTGALDVQGPTARVRIFVEHGQIVYAEDGGISETLGRILLREQVLTDDQYATAIEWMSDAVARGQSVKLGEVLVDLKMLTREQLLAALSAQVRQKAIRALGWLSAHTAFVECHGSLDVSDRYPTALEPLVFAAVKNADEDAIGALFAQSLSRYVSLRGDRSTGGGAARMRTIARLAKFQLPKREDTRARALDGSHTVSEVLASDGGSMLAALLLTDCLDFHAYAQAPRLERRRSSADAMPAVKPPPKRGRPSVRPPPLPPNADAPASTRSGFDAGTGEAPTTRMPVPSSVRPPGIDDRLKAQRVASKLRASREAKQRPLPPPMPEAMPAMTPAAPMSPLGPMARLLAEKAFQAGKKHARVNAMAAAADELRRAAQLYAAPEYQLWAAWATMRAEPEREADHLSALREAAERALDDDPELGFGWYALGFIARKNGESMRAAELLERARSLDADAVELAHDVRIRLGTPQAFVTPGRSLIGLPGLPGAREGLPPAPFLPPVSRAETKGELRALAPPMATPAPAEVETARVDVEAHARGDDAKARERARAIAKAIEDAKQDVIAEVEAHASGRMRVQEVAGEGAKADALASADAMTSADPLAGAHPVSGADVLASADLLASADEAAARAMRSLDAPPNEGANAEASGANGANEQDVEANANANGDDAREAEFRGAADELELGPSSARERSLAEARAPESERSRAKANANGGWAGWVGAALVIAAATGAGVLWLNRSARRTDGPVVQPTSAPLPAVTTATPTAPTAPATSASTNVESASPSSTASAASSGESAVTVLDATSPHAPPDDGTVRPDGSVASHDTVTSTQGTLDFSKGAAGHRVFVDGRVVGEPPAPIVVTCGTHQVKVGSTGREREILVPCGGRIAVPYP